MFSELNSDEIVNYVNLCIDKYGLPRERTKRIAYEDKNKIQQYKDAYIEFREYVNKNPSTLNFYTLMFYSFSQQFRFNDKGSFNMPFGNDCFSEKNIEYIKNGCNFFSNKSNLFYTMDFINFVPFVLELISNPNFSELLPFFYFDPPYFNATAVYNESNWNIDNEHSLYSILDLLSNKNYKWAVSNDLSRNSLIADWIKNHNYNVYTFDNFTYTACGKGNKEGTKEVLITNYDCPIKFNSNKTLF